MAAPMPRISRESPLVNGRSAGTCLTQPGRPRSLGVLLAPHVATCMEATDAGPGPALGTAIGDADHGGPWNNPCQAVVGPLVLCGPARRRRSTREGRANSVETKPDAH